MLDAERSVIGILAAAPENIEYARTRLSGKMFESQELGRIFSAMLKLHKQGKRPDVVLLISVLGDAYKPIIQECADTVPSFSAFEHYVGCVLDGWRMRTMQELAGRITYEGMTADEMLQAMAAEVKHQYDIVRNVRESTEKSFAEAMYATYEQIMQKDTSLKTGIAQFDSALGGFQRGNLYVISARPGKGKTDFSLQLAVTLSKLYSVRFQSMEMTTEQLMQRILSRALRINSVNIRDKMLTEKDMAKIDVAYRRMKDLHFCFDDAGGLTLEDICERAERTKPDILFIDYLGLMRGDPRKKSWEQTQELTNGLKALAKRQNMAVVALAQLNRDVDKKKGKPVLADLRGGGSVEADADCVLYMIPQALDGKILSGDDGVDCEVNIGKNRHGSCGSLQFFWQPQYHSYAPIETRYEE